MCCHIKNPEGRVLTLRGVILVILGDDYESEAVFREIPFGDQSLVVVWLLCCRPGRC